MQTKQHSTCKTHTRIQILTRYTRDYFCGARNFSRKCSKSLVFIYSISWNCIQYIFISRGAVLLCAGNIWNRIQIIVKTAVKGMSDTNLVVFLTRFHTVSELRQRLPNILDRMEMYLDRYDGCDVTGTSSYAVKVFVPCYGHSHDLVILPSVNILDTSTCINMIVICLSNVYAKPAWFSLKKHYRSYSIKI